MIFNDIDIYVFEYKSLYNNEIKLVNILFNI